MRKVAIIGSGSWGSALGIYLASLGNKVNIWSFAEDERDLINNEKKCKFLPKATIPEGVYCSNDMEEVLDGTEIILHGGEQLTNVLKNLVLFLLVLSFIFGKKPENRK